MGDAQDSRLGFYQSDLNTEFFQNVVNGIDPKAALVNWSQNDFDSGTNGIVTALLEDQGHHAHKRMLGLFSFRIKYTLKQGENLEKNVVLKIKPRGEASAKLFRDQCQKLGGDVAKGYQLYYRQIGLLNSEHRDVIALTLNEPCWHGIRPKIYHHIHDNDREIFGYVMDDFKSEDYSHLDTVNNLTLWSDKDKLDVLKGIASFHARFYGRVGEIPEELTRWLDNLHTMTNKPHTQFLWSAMQEQAHLRFPHLVDSELAAILRNAAINIEKIVSVLRESPQTLIHNDLNNRNLCLRSKCEPGLKRLCAYDWEVCGIGCPQRDVVEFLAFTLQPDAGGKMWHKHRETYRSFLQHEIQNQPVSEEVKLSISASLEPNRFKKVFDMCAVEFLYIRLMMYCTTYNFIKLSYLPGVVKNVGSYIKSLTQQYDCLRI